MVATLIYEAHQGDTTITFLHWPGLTQLLQCVDHVIATINYMYSSAVQVLYN